MRKKLPRTTDVAGSSCSRSVAVGHEADRMPTAQLKAYAQLEAIGVETDRLF
jgi:hypothetical protein